jgi:ABC-type transport system involved in multi-copper enzyme maturation permease subunit
MIWLTWRQFRAQALTALALLAAAVIYFLITGLQMRHAYAADLTACTPRNDCDTTLNQFEQTYNAAFQFTQLVVIAAPGLIGIFWGAPLIGRELETGTYQLAWNQSVMRNRWLAAKLAGVGITSIATAGLLSYLLTWWAGPLDQINGNRFAAMTFSSRDVVPLAYAAFAFALGTATGLLLRRTVPAMAVALAVFIGVQILVPATVRPNLLPSTTTTFAINQTTMSHADGIYGEGDDFHFNPLPVPQGAWVLSALPVQNSADQAVHISSYDNCFPGPSATKVTFDVQRISICLAGDDLHESVTYQPASHYWQLQWYETAIFLALAGLLSGFCFWRIRRR